MKPISPFGLPIGISVSFWLLVGIVRYIAEHIFLVGKRDIVNRPAPQPLEIAAVIPAHNEEVVIAQSIRGLKKSLPLKNIHVVSDGSSDSTAKIARKEGAKVLSLNPGKGKAKAIIATLTKFRLFYRYKFIFILDADTFPDQSFVPRALEILKDPEISAVFASPHILWPPHKIPRLKYYFVAYRERLNRMLQYMMIYGMTWKFTNVNYVIPGYCTIYRSSILKQLNLDTPGLLIEDFNTAFQMHKKKLGKIGYTFGLIGWDQHPQSLRDYWRQVRRWNIGFFQTIRINGMWFSFFWISLVIFTIEVVLHSVFLLVLPIWFVAYFIPFPPPLSAAAATITNALPLSLMGIFLSVFLFDYLLTVLIGINHRKPQFLFYGLFFIFMHFVTSLILFTAIIPGLLTKSEGRWTSPTRRKEVS